MGKKNTNNSCKRTRRTGVAFASPCTKPASQAHIHTEETVPGALESGVKDVRLDSAPQRERGFASWTKVWLSMPFPC